MKIESFDHIHVYSKHPKESADFYIKHFEAEKLYQKEGIGGKRVFLSLGGQVIVLGPLPNDRQVSETTAPGSRHKIGLDHFGIRVKNLKLAIENLRGEGVDIIAEPVKGSSGISYAFVSAPDGVIIELTEYGLVPKIFLKAKKVI